MTPREILKEMFTLQQTLNDGTNGEGWESGYTNQGKFISWKRCIHMECAELIDSFAWKHWKHIAKPTDWENVRVEVVDIWHFVMSLLLEHYYNENKGGVDQLVEDVANTQGFRDFCKEAYDPNGFDDLELINDIESLIHGCTGYELELFDGLLRRYFDVALKCGINLGTLYRYYVAKNVLNRFRQDNGYKEGSYQKIWNGKEDNVVMLELLGEPMPTIDALYNALSQQYKALGA
ncbi:dUTP diphosphatase [Sulfurospirillum sp. T05]|uniref:dUTP diphosphatase n=1 Tax=Sulfurospirillum tamanense TaxID=2813362 RepID=A0ABS2WNL2_9BACT|nr:dUTP diphosphatase [Sulfurospirillum tamanensis]MBN2963190.1 dUTP diphosphatase [Sulfurospirillum tamanensis]